VTASNSPTDDAAHSFSVVGGNPSASEIAAVTAVVTNVLDELAAERGRRATVDVSAWQRSARPVREPIVRGLDAWRGFSG
jgi:hypothetical protein